MPLTPRNLVMHELIGLDVAVASSSNKSAAGLSGRVVDETRNTITIWTAGGEKSIPKDTATFVFALPSGERVRVEGSVLVGRPEDRIKKKHKKW